MQAVQTIIIADDGRGVTEGLRNHSETPPVVDPTDASHDFFLRHESLPSWKMSNFHGKSCTVDVALSTIALKAVMNNKSYIRHVITHFVASEFNRTNEYPSPFWMVGCSPFLATKGVPPPASSHCSHSLHIDKVHTQIGGFIGILNCRVHFDCAKCVVDGRVSLIDSDEMTAEPPPSLLQRKRFKSDIVHGFKGCNCLCTSQTETKGRDAVLQKLCLKRKMSIVVNRDEGNDVNDESEGDLSLKSDEEGVPEEDDCDDPLLDEEDDLIDDDDDDGGDDDDLPDGGLQRRRRRGGSAIRPVGSGSDTDFDDVHEADEEEIE